MEGSSFILLLRHCTAFVFPLVSWQKDSFLWFSNDCLMAIKLAQILKTSWVRNLMEHQCQHIPSVCYLHLHTACIRQWEWRGAWDGVWTLTVFVQDSVDYSPSKEVRVWVPQGDHDRFTHLTYISQEFGSHWCDFRGKKERVLSLY